MSFLTNQIDKHFGLNHLVTSDVIALIIDGHMALDYYLQTLLTAAWNHALISLAVSRGLNCFELTNDAQHSFNKN